MISFYYRNKDEFISRDEVADAVSRLDGFALIEWIGRTNPMKYKSYCIYWNDYEEFNLREFKLQLDEHKEYIKCIEDCI